MNTLHAAGTTEPHGQLAAAPRPRPPAKRPADESEGVALTVIPAVVGALVGLGILVAVGLGLTGQAGGLAALGHGPGADHAPHGGRDVPLRG